MVMVTVMVMVMVMTMMMTIMKTMHCNAGVGEGWWERIADLPHRLYAHACTYLPQVMMLMAVATMTKMMMTAVPIMTMMMIYDDWPA